MSKEENTIDLAKSKALNIPVVMWRFCAYKSETKVANIIL